MKKALRPVLLSLSLIASVSNADIHAVVVGIDDYTHEMPLDGAVNDANDLATVLTKRGAEVTLLRNKQASRTAIFAALRKAIAKAQPGDSIVFSYAGHGTRFPEALAGDEDDGLDETFILSDFQPSGDASRQRIRDNDIAALLLEARDGVGVLVIADSCHSGTMTRNSGNANTFGRLRWSPNSALQEDTLEAPSERTSQLKEEALGNVVFASGALDDQTVVEIEIDGQKRGALSWTIARMIESGGKSNSVETTLLDVRSRLRSEVRQRTYALQDANLNFDDDLLSDRKNQAALAIHALFNASHDDGVVNRVDVEIAELSMVEPPEVYSLKADETLDSAPKTARLTHDPAGRALYDRASGDLLAKPKDETSLKAAVQSWRAARGLALWVPERSADPRLSEGDGQHKIGDTITIQLTPPENALEHRNVILVNLAATGTVQFVFPSAKTVKAGKDRIAPHPHQSKIASVPVTEPVGADNLIAIFTEKRHDVLLNALRALDGKADPSALLGLLQKHASDPRIARVGLLTIYTGAKQ